MMVRTSPWLQIAGNSGGWHDVVRYDRVYDRVIWSNFEIIGSRDIFRGWRTIFDPNTETNSRFFQANLQHTPKMKFYGIVTHASSARFGSDILPASQLESDVAVVPQLDMKICPKLLQDSDNSNRPMLDVVICQEDLLQLKNKKCPEPEAFPAKYRCLLMRLKESLSPQRLVERS